MTALLEREGEAPAIAFAIAARLFAHQTARLPRIDVYMMSDTLQSFLPSILLSHR
jgi:hypothetical protein